MRRRTQRGRLRKLVIQRFIQFVIVIQQQFKLVILIQRCYASYLRQ